MSETTTLAAAVCRSCNKEPADATGIGPACRARAMAAAAAMEAQAAAARQAEADAKAAKQRKPPTKAQKEAAPAANRLAGDLARLLGKPAPPPLTDGELVEELDRMEADAANPPPQVVRVRVKVGGLVPPRVITCIQCPQAKPFRPDPDNTASRCGTCVRKNKAAMRDFQGR